MAVVYEILNLSNGHRYVGSAIDFNIRKRIHMNSLKGDRHHSIYLQRAWNLYGESGFQFSIIEDNIEPHNLIEREQWWFDNSICSYNIAKIAGSSLGIKRRKETKDKLRNVQLGRIHPPWRLRLKSISQGGRNHYNYGKKLSDSTKKRKSESLKKKYKDGWEAPRSKPVIQLSLSGEFIAEFKSLRDAAKHLGGTDKNIGNCARGVNKTACGYKWKYKN